MPLAASRKLSFSVIVTSKIAKAEMVTDVARGEAKSPRNNFFDLIAFHSMQKR